MNPAWACPGCGFRLSAEDAVRCLSDRQGHAVVRRPSGVGVLSCVVALVGVGLIGLVWPAGIGLSPAAPLLVVLGAFGAVLGAVGLKEAGRGRLFPVLGLVLNSLVLVGCGGLGCFRLLS